MSYHLSPLKNIFENSRSMPHHLSALKNNSKNLKKSPHATPPFYIEKFLKIQVVDYITSYHITFLY
jgi:hypothetical protein